MTDTKKPTKKQAQQFVRDVCRSIRENEFNMGEWRKNYYNGKSAHVVPTCGTALCKAGHIVAVRAKRARELLKEDPAQFRLRDDVISFRPLAKRIFLEETGTELPEAEMFVSQTKREACKALRALVGL